MSTQKKFYAEIMLWIEADNEADASGSAERVAVRIVTQTDSFGARVTSATVNSVEESDDAESP